MWGVERVAVMWGSFRDAVGKIAPSPAKRTEIPGTQAFVFLHCVRSEKVKIVHSNHSLIIGLRVWSLSEEREFLGEFF